MMASFLISTISSHNEEQHVIMFKFLLFDKLSGFIGWNIEYQLFNGEICSDSCFEEKNEKQIY